MFLYFSGHGGRIDDGPHRGQFLLPVDTIYPSADDLARTAISGAEFTAALGAIKARRLTVVLDCCHAGGIGEPRDLVPTEKVESGVSDNYPRSTQVRRGTGDHRGHPRGRSGLCAGRGEVRRLHRPLPGRPARRGSGAGGVIRIFDLYDYTQTARSPPTSPTSTPSSRPSSRRTTPSALYRGGQIPAAVTAAPPPADGFAHDAYISFSKEKSDKTWARKTLLPALRAAGLNVVSEDDFALGAPLIDEMERHVVKSRYTLGILTPRSLTDNFADLNRVLSRHLGLEKDQRRFIGVMRERCQPRLSIRALYYLDMTDDDEFDINLARLVAQLRQAPDLARADGG